MKKLLVVLLVLVSAVALIAEPEWLIEDVAGHLTIATGKPVLLSEKTARVFTGSFL